VNYGNFGSIAIYYIDLIDIYFGVARKYDSKWIKED